MGNNDVPRNVPPIGNNQIVNEGELVITNATSIENTFNLFDNLPLELSLNILRYLNPNERKQFATASHSSYALAYHNYVWRQPYEVKTEPFMRFGYLWRHIIEQPNDNNLSTYHLMHLSESSSIAPHEFKKYLENKQKKLCKPENGQELWLQRKQNYFAKLLQLDITKKHQALQKQAKTLQETSVGDYTLADVITAQTNYVNNRDERYLDMVQQAEGKHYEQALYYLQRTAELETILTDVSTITKALILPILQEQGLLETSDLPDSVYGLLLENRSQNLSSTAIMILLSFSEDAAILLLKATQETDVIAIKARNLLSKLTNSDWLLVLKYHLGARTETDLATLVDAFATQNSAFMRNWTEQELIELAQVKRLPESGLINPFNLAKKHPFAIHILRNQQLRAKLTDDRSSIQVAAKISPYEIDWLDSADKASLMRCFIRVLNDNELRECFFNCTHHYDSIWSNFLLKQEEIIAYLNQDGLMDCLSRIPGTGFQQLATKELLRERLIELGPEAVVQLFRRAPLRGYEEVFLDDERMLAMLEDAHIAEIFKILRSKSNGANRFLEKKPRNFQERLNLPLLNRIIAGDVCPISDANYAYCFTYLQQRGGVTEAVITAGNSAATDNSLHEDKQQADKSFFHSTYAFIAGLAQRLLTGIKYILSEIRGLFFNKDNPLAPSPVGIFSEQSIQNSLGNNNPTATASYSFDLLDGLTVNRSEATDNVESADISLIL